LAVYQNYYDSATSFKGSLIIRFIFSSQDNILNLFIERMTNYC